MLLNLASAMTTDSEPFERAAQIARVLRPLGREAMSIEQAQVAGRTSQDRSDADAGDAGAASVL